MLVSLVMTVIGRDRPGLVESLASLIAQHGGNWLESRMCRLGGDFAGILRLQVEAEAAPPMTEALRGLAAQGLTVVAHSSPAESPAEPTRLARLELVGQDRPGIVRQISSALAQHGVNVEELTTECCSAAMSGETLFKAQAKLSIPATRSLAEIRANVERLAADLMVDISLDELPLGHD